MRKNDIILLHLQNDKIPLFSIPLLQSKDSNDDRSYLLSLSKKRDNVYVLIYTTKSQGNSVKAALLLELKTVSRGLKVSCFHFSSVHTCTYLQ